MNVIISKESTQRLLKDVRQIMLNPLTDNGIYYVHDEQDMLKGYVMIVGPEGTPYFGGYYFFEINYPTNYPHSPPQIKYMTNGKNIRFNPNLYVNGKVCLSILNTWSGDQWTSCQTISTLLLTLCTVLRENPLINEPGVLLGHRDVEPYNYIIEYANIDIAICDIIMKQPYVFHHFFNLFYMYAVEHMVKNHDKMIEFMKTRMEKFEHVPLLRTGFYNLTVSMDYEKLYEKYMNSYEIAIVLYNNENKNENKN
jgi:ubiquitin-protein ligase